MLYFVYALIDPRTNIVGYVGLTDDPKARFRQHLRADGSSESQRKNAWVRQILAEHVSPQMYVLEVVYDVREQAESRERYWISYYTNHQVLLVNKHHVKGTFDYDLVSSGTSSFGVQENTSSSREIGIEVLENGVVIQSVDFDDLARLFLKQGFIGTWN